MNIEWKTIARAPAYEVSEFGQVRRTTGGQGARAGQIQKWHTCTGTGYPDARIRVEGRTITVPIHRLVASAFLGEKPAGMEIRHLDGNKMNCHYKNLAYGTHRQNQQDKILHGTSSAGERNPTSKLTWPKVAAIRTDFALGCRAKDLAIAYKVSASTIHRILAGTYWQEASNRNMDRSAA